MSDWDDRFSTDEYSRRVGQVRDAMGKRGIDLLLAHTPENLFYLSGYDTSGYFAYQFIALPLTGEPEILIRRGEAENARRSTIKRRSQSSTISNNDASGRCSSMRAVEPWPRSVSGSRSIPMTGPPAAQST